MAVTIYPWSVVGLLAVSGLSQLVAPGAYRTLVGTSGIKSYNSFKRKVLSAFRKMVGYPASQGERHARECRYCHRIRSVHRPS